MQPIKLYTSSWCAYCVAAKHFLSSLGANFEEIDISTQPDLADQLQATYNWRSVPMIFIKDEFIGGYDDMMRLHQQGLLKDKIFS